MQHPGELPGMTWGLRDLNEKTGGIHRGELVVLAARPSMGKTALAVTVSRLTAEAGYPGLFFSLEMIGRALADRVLADIAFDHRYPIEYSRIGKGDLSDREATRLIDAQQQLKRLDLRVGQEPALTVSQIAARARRHQQSLERAGKRLGVVIVDHMHLVRASERYKGNRTAEITEISGGLKSLAKELDVPVIALAQLSRGPETREEKRPMLSDFRDSGSIEQDADVICFLYREAYYLGRTVCAEPAKDGERLARLHQVERELEVLISKQRSGPIGTVKVFCDIGCNAIRDAARHSIRVAA
jgi:replicative DNA helicase